MLLRSALAATGSGSTLPPYVRLFASLCPWIRLSAVATAACRHQVTSDIQSAIPRAGAPIDTQRRSRELLGAGAFVTNFQMLSDLRTTITIDGIAADKMEDLSHALTQVQCAHVANLLMLLYVSDPRPASRC